MGHGVVRTDSGDEDTGGDGAEGEEEEEEPREIDEEEPLEHVSSNKP
jgi:hypothetical protein